jgi:hypothetical protein
VRSGAECRPPPQKTSADCDTRHWFSTLGAIIFQPMGRNVTADWLPHYREVLVANAVRAVRDSLPVVEAFTAERRARLVQPVARADWRAVAIAAAAISAAVATR